MQKWSDYFDYSRSERSGIITLVVLTLIITIASNIWKTRIYNKNIEVIRNLESSLLSRQELEAKEPKNSTYKEFDKPKVSSQKIGKSNRAKQKSVQTKIDKKELTTKDLNEISAQELQSHYNISSKTSYRLKKLGEKLGGYHSIDQVEDVYEISQDEINLLTASLELSQTTIRRVKINVLSAEELSMHPYISKGLASQIINYRTKVKFFEATEDIKALYFVDEELYSKLAPYISVEK